MENPFCIVTEFYPKGSLRKVLQCEELPPMVILEIIKGIARGLNHLHRTKLVQLPHSFFLEELIIHRDVAARNVLLTDTFQAKISDFGMSRVLHSQSDSGSTKSDVGMIFLYILDLKIGPIKWMAKECIVEKKFSTKSDVWAFGMSFHRNFCSFSRNFIG